MIGEFKIGVFVTLKNSARNSSLLNSRQREFLLNTEIRGAQTGAAYCAYATSSKSARNSRRIRSGIEPLEATKLSGKGVERGLSSKHVRWGNAVGSRSAGAGAGSVGGVNR